MALRLWPTFLPAPCCGNGFRRRTRVDPRLRVMADSDRRVARAHDLIDEEPTTLETPHGMVGRLHQLSSALARDLQAYGVGLCLLTEDHSGGGTAAASNPVSRLLDDLQFSLGEGPCIDAYATRRPVLEPDLPGPGHCRWPVYGPAASEHGLRAVFAFPLQVGLARLGALDVFCREPGSLSTRGVSQAVTFADIAVTVLLDAQGDAAEGELADGLDDVLANRVEVYQAQGITMLDLGVSLEVAMARLRAYAYAQNRHLSDVARDIVAGRLRLHRDRLVGTAPDADEDPPAAGGEK